MRNENSVLVDRQIEELTQYINKVELQVNDLLDENEGMREKLGLDPRKPMDLGEFRKKKTLRLQGDRALNMALQQEVGVQVWIAQGKICLLGLRKPKPF